MRTKSQQDKFIIILLAIAFIALAFRYYQVAGESEAKRYDVKSFFSYTVSEGDTLWRIAESIRSPEQDTRRVIKDIVKLNRIFDIDNIRAGQELALPLYWEYVKHLEKGGE